jgi:hypothetical protein
MHRLSLPPPSLQVLDYHADPDADGARLILTMSRQVGRPEGSCAHGVLAEVLESRAGDADLLAGCGNGIDQNVLRLRGSSTLA